MVNIDGEKLVFFPPFFLPYLPFTFIVLLRKCLRFPLLFFFFLCVVTPSCTLSQKPKKQRSIQQQKKNALKRS